MKPRKLNIKTIPAPTEELVNRNYRFWRDVFDLLQDGNGGDRHLIVDHATIDFVLGDVRDDLELLVRDHIGELQAHLRNHFVPVVSEVEERFGNKVALRIQDPAGNIITIEANK
ncbi:MAG TPA: lactoylglutathione lyase [Lactobacillaceae bacterium]|jgi:hypothetical protein